MPSAKPKSVISAVRGKVRTLAADTGEVISQWGGSEVFLSIEPIAGPAVVIKASRHKRGQGTILPLSQIERVLATHLDQGKATLIAHHERRRCTFLIDADDDVDLLRSLVGTIGSRERWNHIEHGVLSKERTRNRQSGTSASIPDVTVPERPTTLDGGGATSHSPGHSRATSCESVELDDRTAALTGRPIAPSETIAHTPEQVHALGLVRQGKSVFVTGCAGSGKSAFLRSVRAMLSPETTAVTASTAQAARQIDGVTLHSFAGIGNSATDLASALRRVKNSAHAMRAWRRTQVLIVDEVSMLSAALFDLLDQVARHVRNAPGHAFGRIQIIACGDFLQLPPVEGSMAFTSVAWRELELVTVTLTRSWRQLDREFPAILHRARLGQLTVDDELVLSTRMVDTPPKDAVHIEATRAAADAANDRFLAELGGDFTTYRAEDSGSLDSTELDSATPLVRELTLRIGARVIAVTSDASQGIRNGDIGTVVSFSSAAGSVFASVPVVLWEVAGTESPVGATASEVSICGKVVSARIQLPLRLAWALTVHRVQGLSMERVALRLDGSMFEAGQAYVALSRARSLQGIFLLGTSVSKDACWASKEALKFLNLESVAA
jgi:ATP-dependent DNA helicase PIF1